MSIECCHTPESDQHRNNAAYKKVLWVVLAINAAMFLIELVGGTASVTAGAAEDQRRSYGPVADRAAK